MPARNPPKLTMYDNFPILRLFRWIGRVFTGKIRGQSEEFAARKTEIVEGPIPLEITLVLSK
jgi:hypothetical protein